jgi:hypothetical protein
MNRSFRNTCRRLLHPGALRARRVALRLPLVLYRKSLQARRHAARRTRCQPDTLLLRPFRPHIEDDYTVTLISCRLGLRLTTDARDRFAAAMHWNDTTRRPPDSVLEAIARSRHVVNLRGNDISKTRVDTVMRDIFGYGLGVDPLTTGGPVLEKSDLNAFHDGRILEGPLATAAPGRVYQRVVRGRRTGDVVEEIRVPVIGHRVPFVYLKDKRADDPLALSIRGTIVEPSSVLAPAEIDTLLRFSHALGIDFGELDAMRDNADGRIYVFDANNTPCVRFVGVSAADRRATIDRLAEAFEAEFLKPDSLPEIRPEHDQRERP